MMIKRFNPTISSILFIGLLFLVYRSQAQDTDSLKQKEIKFFSRLLTIDNVKAGRVAAIRDTYNGAVRNVLTDKTLPDQDKRARIDQLIINKNAQLSTLLTATQLNKINGKLSPDSLNRQKQVKYLISKLSISENKARQVNAVIDEYKAKVGGIMNNSNLSEQGRRTQINDLITVKNSKLSAMLAPSQIEIINPVMKPVSINHKPHLQSREMVAAQDTFERKLKLLFANHKLSEQNKHEQIDLILKERNENIVKIRAKQAEAGLKSQTSKPQQP
jgi:hypothetical protein